MQNTNSNDNFSTAQQKKIFLDDIQLFSINSINNKEYQSSDLNSQLVKIYENNIQNNEKIKNYLSINNIVIIIKKIKSK